MVAPDDIAAYRADGAVYLPGLFAAWVQRLRDATSQIMATPSKLERSYQPPGSARFFQDLCRWQDIKGLHEFVMHAGAAQAAAQLMGCTSVRFFHDHILVKEPGSAVVTPWHQDLPYYCVEGPHRVSFWIPLDPVEKSVALRCVAGSHLWGAVHRPKRFDGTDLFAEDTRAEVPDIDADPAKYRILAWDMQPGDAIAFDYATIHGAAATVGATARRRVVSVRFVGDGTVFRDRLGKGSPPFAEVTLRDGEALTDPWFPLVAR